MTNTIRALLIFTVVNLFGIRYTIAQKPKPSLVSIETADLSLVFKKDSDSTLKLSFFGEKVQDKEALLKKTFLHRPDTDETFEPSGYLAYGGRVFQEPALKITHANGALTTELTVIGYNRQSNGDATMHTIQLKDKVYDLYVDLIFEAFHKENIITQSVKITNKEKGTVQLHNFYSFYLPVSSQSYYLTQFHGTWAREMQLAESRLAPGIKSVESKKGNRTTQSENSSFILSLNQKAQPYSGEVIMGSLAWTGNYKLNFEVDETNQLNILAGINPFSASYPLASGQNLVTPKMVFTYSNTGYNQASRNFHDWARRYSLYEGDKINEIVLNSWEGAYFDFTEEKIIKIIDDAASMGVEVFVLDDGWFGNKYPRNSDKMGLGDWQVNTKKLPGGIDYLAKHARAKGLRFGIWIEPEMVNPQSELAERHPEWVVKSPHRDMPTLRNQWLLDLSNPAVQDFIVKTFDDVTALSKDISYIKWDANRHVESAGSAYLDAYEQSKFWIAYINGLYNIYERIRKKHPNITIQLCSSGGGRLDYKALQYHNEFWPSDNTDPYTRIPLQFATNLFFPAKAMATHVTVSPNHQTGNVSSLKLRCDVAMMGRMGIELQPKDMSEKDFDFLKKAISNYKKVRDIVQLGDVYTVWSPYDEGEWSATSYVSKDQSKALLFYFSLNFHERTLMPTFRLHGLDKNARYKISELNAEGNIQYPGNGEIISGDYLMKVGINPNIQWQGSSGVLYLEKQP
ncbi:alpha-galactosidase [Niabella aquatica]